jgi:hypothetical protein
MYLVASNLLRRTATHYATYRLLAARRFRQTRTPAIVHPVAKKSRKLSDKNRRALPAPVEEIHEALR